MYPWFTAIIQQGVAEVTLAVEEVHCQAKEMVVAECEVALVGTGAVPRQVAVVFLGAVAAFAEEGGVLATVEVVGQVEAVELVEIIRGGHHSKTRRKIHDNIVRSP